MDMDLEALAIAVRGLEGKGFMEPEAQAVDGGEVDVVVQGGRGRQESLDRLHTKDGGKPGGDLRTKEREGVPITLEDVLREEADPAIAEAHGCGSEVVDSFAVQAVALQLLFRDAVGGFVVELSQ
jgi:hypothetical protein